MDHLFIDSIPIYQKVLKLDYFIDGYKKPSMNKWSISKWHLLLVPTSKKHLKKPKITSRLSMWLPRWRFTQWCSQKETCQWNQRHHGLHVLMVTCSNDNVGMSLYYLTWFQSTSVGDHLAHIRSKIRKYQNGKAMLQLFYKDITKFYNVHSSLWWYVQSSFSSLLIIQHDWGLLSTFKPVHQCIKRFHGHNQMSNLYQGLSTAGRQEQ